MGLKWQEIIFPDYEVRKTKKQKTAFIEMLRSHFGDRLRVEECGSLVKSRNIVIGDPEKARVIYTAHYDTCTRLPFPNFITPRNFFLYLLMQIFVALILFIPVFLLTVLVGTLTRALPLAWGFVATEGTLFLSLAAVLWFFFGGPANPHTANDNTSGVVTVLSLADASAGSSPDAAFILFDNEENGLLGSAGYAAAHRDIRQNTLLVNFDCVSDGKRFLMLFSKRAMELPYYRALKERADAVFADRGQTAEVCPKKGTFYPSDQANFKTCAAVCALNESPRIGLYMNRIHTIRDTVFEEDNIAALIELFSDPTLTQQDKKAGDSE
ncbi:MAG: M28 family peptidase [Clostridia bacterium]|nr:M28 family peptidase [Clostridia bacterium]